jgi:hypothetical protein
MSRRIELTLVDTYNGPHFQLLGDNAKKRLFIVRYDILLDQQRDIVVVLILG